MAVRKEDGVKLISERRPLADEPFALVSGVDNAAFFRVFVSGKITVRHYLANAETFYFHGVSSLT
ncbi:hypothetical protein SDC9_178952 [bioreactor metagenome]|uniref:Uncharacterized protein n=1 Tax=bioreactor metagenome TaxID=1076179 RepID=A0A645GXM1_9ZZZZ